MSSFTHKDQHYIWHPFTQHGIEKETIPITNAQDASLFTDNNHEIIDCISSWWTITHGHNHPYMNQKVKQQIDTMSHVMFAGFTHPPAIKLAESLIRASNNNFSKVFFADNGSGAVEVALKMAYQYHVNHGAKDKTLFLAFDGAYHGDTFGAMATGRTTGFYDPFEPFLCDVRFVPYPHQMNNPEILAEKEKESLDTLEKILQKHKNHIACMILEPLMQGAKGMRFCRPAFLKQLCTLLKKHNILIIFDEVATGFGRLGTLFAYEQIDIIPDFICLSKGLTGGMMPLSVVMTHDKIYNSFLGSDYKKSFTHGHSFTANPLACSAANAAIELFEKENTFEKIQKINDFYTENIPQLKNLSSIENCRMMGSVLAWDLKNDNMHYKSLQSEKIKDIFLKEGLNIRPLGKVFYLLPPYCITRAQLEHVFNRIKYIFEHK